MKLYSLSRTDRVTDGYDSFVVRAEDEVEARKLALDYAAKNTLGGSWPSDAKKVKCDVLPHKGKPGVVLVSCRAS